MSRSAVAGDTGSGDLFSADFEAGGSTWSSKNGTVADSADRAKAGLQSSKAILVPTESDYGKAAVTGTPTKYHIRFFFNPVNLLMTLDGERFSLVFGGIVGTDHVIDLLLNGSNLQLLTTIQQGGAANLGIFTTVATYQQDKWVQVDLFIDGSIGAGSNVGRVWYNAQLAGEKTDAGAMANGLIEAQIGGRTGVDANTSGPLYMDCADIWSTEHNPT